MKQGKTLIVGVGEVGGALAEVLERHQPVLRLDVSPRDFADPIDVMHICFPYQTEAGFEGTVASYIERFKPQLTVVNSTVVPGTVRTIAERSAALVAYSPVRGKHARMPEELLHYTKFIAAPEAIAAERAAEHFAAAGMKTQLFKSPESLELAKLAETTYFGVLIAFAQELDRLANQVGGDYAETVEFFREVEFLPRTTYFPGFIGGHCVIPNIKLLKSVARSGLFDAVLESNDRRAAELAAHQSADQRVAIPEFGRFDEVDSREHGKEARQSRGNH